jgi:hypothetical protein
MENEDKQLTKSDVFQLIEHIGKHEMHFNGLETEYRKLASQWLLAALGASGFILQKDFQFEYKWYLVLGICLAASVGICVLFLMDIKVYHQLLHSFFTERIKLEADYPQFLPAIGIRMVQTQESGDVVSRILYYYFISIVLLICLAGFAIFNIQDLKKLLLIKIFILLFFATGLFYLLKWMKGPTSKSEISSIVNKYRKRTL